MKRPATKPAPMVQATATAHRPPPPPGLGRGMLLALLAHGLLVAMLSAGLSWRSQSPPAFEAELWSAVPVAAAPKEVLPPPEPEPKVETKPDPKPAPRPEPPPEAQAQRDAEIALAKQREKKQREELEAKRQAELEKQRKKELEKERERKEKEREKERQQQREKEAREERERKEKARQAEARAEAQREAQRKENLKRIQGMAGASGAPNATGTALKSAGPSSSYAGRIKASIRPNIIYIDSGNTNPVAEVEVRVLPDGTITGRKLLKASGDPDWDRAVLRAIDKTETLPRDVDGRVPPVMVIGFQPRE